MNEKDKKKIALFLRDFIIHFKKSTIYEDFYLIPNEYIDDWISDYLDEKYPGRELPPTFCENCWNERVACTCM